MSFFPTRTLVIMCGIAATASACVTINIYFPAAAAEKAADRIIDEVWQLRDATNSTPAASPAPTKQGVEQ